MRTAALVAAFALATPAASASETVFLYDDSSAMAVSVNDVIIWKDAATAAANPAKPAIDAGNIRKIACIVKPKRRAGAVSRSGRVVEVKGRFVCHGFVNSRFVHASKP
jgi:hypothetical protein